MSGAVLEKEATVTNKPVEPGVAMVARVGPAEYRYPEFASPPRANSAKGTPGPLFERE